MLSEFIFFWLVLFLQPEKNAATVILTQSRDFNSNESLTIWNRVSKFKEANDVEMIYDDRSIDLNSAVFKFEASELGLKTKRCHNLGQLAIAGWINVLAA